jgi:hypothetical protein
MSQFIYFGGNFINFLFFHREEPEKNVFFQQKNLAPVWD